MARVDIRNISPNVIKKYDDEAKKRGISREQLLRNLLEEYILLKEKEVERNEYKNMIDKVLLQLKFNSKVIDENSKVIEKNNDLLDSIID